MPIEWELGRSLLYLACHHHVLELLVSAVFMKVLGLSLAQEVQLFKRLKARWMFVNHEDYDHITSDANARQIVEEDDYFELLELTIVFLGGAPPGGIRF